MQYSYRVSCNTLHAFVLFWWISAILGYISKILMDRYPSQEAFVFTVYLLLTILLAVTVADNTYSNTLLYLFLCAKSCQELSFFFIEVVFYWGSLPLRFSFIEVIFHWGIYIKVYQYLSLALLTPLTTPLLWTKQVFGNPLFEYDKHFVPNIS